MDVKLSKEIAYFLSEIKRLRKLHRETKKCFDDINNGGSIVKAELSPEDDFIQDACKRTPCIIVVGSNNPAKATVVNALFGKPVLPIIWNETGYRPWRTVRFKHGMKTSASLSVQGSYELVDNLVGQQGNWSTVPTEDLQVDYRDQLGQELDMAHACAVLDIKMRNVLLAEGGEIVVAQGLDGRETLEEVYKKCTANVLPVFVYVVDQPVFSVEEVNQLKELKVIDPHINFFFVPVQRPRDAETSINHPQTTPMERIRDTLVKNHISHSYSKDQRQSYSLKTNANNNVSKTPEVKRKKNSESGEEPKKRGSLDDIRTASTRSISRYLPCEEHGKASCPKCILTDSMKAEVQQNGTEAMDSSESESESSSAESEPEESGNYNSMETQISARQSLFIRQDSAQRFKPILEVSYEAEAVPPKIDYQPYSKSPQIKRNNSLTTMAGDDVHRDYALSLFQQLLDCNYLSILPVSSQMNSQDTGSYEFCDSELVESFENLKNLVQYVHQQLQRALINTVSLLNVVHSRCLHSFILTAFDMARDMQVTPRKLEYARMKEKDLYQSLMLISDKKQDEIRDMIAETVEFMRERLLQRAEEYDFIGVEIPESGQIQSARDLKICTEQIQQLVLEHLNSSIATKLLNSMDILKDSYTGVLARCLESLEKSEAPSPESVRATMALQEILNSAYQVEITVSAGASILRMLYEKMKQLMQAMAWRNLARVDNEWKRKVAADMLDTISEHRLARSICWQIRERLKHSHESFEAALRHLQQLHSGRLERTEEQRLKVRKVHAPRVARLALESISMKDYLVNGMPRLGPEIGRGQYGVVYSCDKWSGRGPCAIKSVVPPDDKHWNDLALEFYYTKNVPEHPRVVALRGSVIDYTYGGSCESPAVLLIMDRLQRDLYAAIKSNLDWLSRVQVAIDVVEGIRFLHSQGLVHRDIKLKNVLLDRENRGLVTDLGFCKPEAMMSGSIVGTPIHMAPELFSGKYDNSVDTYAFGILFWYVCAGHVRLPFAFEQCTNKEMLWTSVKRGVRPEKQPNFDPDCWELMQSCWAADPDKRPHLGDVQPRLQAIFDRYARDPRAIRFSARVRKHKSCSAGSIHQQHFTHNNGAPMTMNAPSSVQVREK